MKFFILKTILIIILVYSHASVACEYKTMQVLGVARTEIICAQLNATKPMPAVLVFHGRGGTAQDMAEGIHLHELWPEAAVVYLDGMPGVPAPYDKEGIGSGWQLNPGEVHDRDIAFVDQTIDELTKHYNVDKRYIFATGHSNGASFLGVLWLTRAKLFAGFAFSASQAGQLIETVKPLPIFMGMGKQDQLIPFEIQKESIKYAAAKYGVNSVQTERTGVSLYKGKAGIEFMIFIHEGKHVWPAAQSKLIVDFFKSQISKN